MDRQETINQQNESKQSDNKVVVLFLAMALAVLVVLSGLSVAVYYLSKNANLVDRFKAELVEADVVSTTNDSVADEVAYVDEIKDIAESDVALIIKQEPVTPQVAQKACFKYTVYEGQFKSSKCYTQDDYEALGYYLGKYSSAEFSKESAESTIDFTCDKDFFKNTCDNAKKEKKQAESDMSKYTNELVAIISRGW